MLSTIIIFILVLSVLVFAHELGHFVTAKRLGVRADEFGFGFPPRMVGFYKNKFGKWRKVFGKTTYEDLESSTLEDAVPQSGSTIYSLNWLPIGGFVKIKGENDNGDKEADSFAAKKVWQRMLILSAGVIMNVVLAWFLFTVGYLIGMPQATSDLSSSARVSNAMVAIIDVRADSPAEVAGLRAGDFIKAINGQEVALEEDMQAMISPLAGQEVTLLVDREQTEMTIVVVPEEVSEGHGVIGVGIMAAGTVRYPLFSAIIEGAKTTGWMLKEIVLAFGNLIGNLVSGESVSQEFAGPVGIANITGQAASLGFVYLLQFVALLSLNLAIINILPFPALDGGRILFLLIEKVKGKPVKRDIEAVAHNIGFLLLIALIIFITYKDIIKLF
ncbi:MAG: RIP metalloprotease RseP [Patescibacteria group bacterium]|jgi:regulator of sigma E protease|nr:RIP metalloprotease RseP [bacterium]HQC49747.1 RIP metalloprotease RseP [bacterium]